MRVANVYDLSTKILLFKFAKPDVKQQLVIDIGFRCHVTEFARTTAGMPSAFVARLRKFLKTRRLTSVNQIGTDRILEFQFSDGQYRLFLEFFAVRYSLMSNSKHNTNDSRSERQHYPYRCRFEDTCTVAQRLRRGWPGVSAHWLAILHRKQTKFPRYSAFVSRQSTRCAEKCSGQSAFFAGHGPEIKVQALC